MKESYTSKRRVRRSFGKIDAVSDMPSLIEVQTGSYASFIEQDKNAEPCEFGLEEVFKSIFPIKDFSGNGELEFVKYELEEPKYDVDECIKRDMTYAAPVKATLRLVVWDTDEATGAKSIHDIKEQDVYMGDIPLMTDKGTFIFNGTERVVVSQMHRSPGVVFAHDKGKTGASGNQASQDHLLAEQVVTLLGGVSNIAGATNCATRLRVEVADPSIVADNASFVAVGAKGLIITGKTAQVIIGISVPRVKEHFDQIMGLEPGFVPTTSASPAASAAHKRGDICFFDIDGTLAWQDPRVAQELPESERDLSPYPNEAVSQAIRDFVANGNMAFICTGRTLSCIHPKLLELPWTGIVCLAGGYAEINGNAIRDLSMTPSMLQRLAPYLEQSGEVIRFEGLNGVVRMSADAPDAPGYARTLGDAVTQLQHYSVYKILMSTSLASRIAQDKALEPLLCFNELELEVTEISPRECTKRGGIQSVLDALDPHHGTVYGIGDASNDVSLMNAVDVGIAMGNAPDYLKKRADYITDSVDKDGVVKALEHFRLI